MAWNTLASAADAGGSKPPARTAVVSGALATSSCAFSKPNASLPSRRSCEKRPPPPPQEKKDEAHRNENLKNKN
jgi:hypothetical protein